MDTPDIPEQLPADINPEREAMLRAAAIHERWETERAEMFRLIEKSKIALQVKDNHILTLEAALAEERNRYVALNNTYLDVCQDRADLQAILANHQADLESHAAKLARFEFSRIKRKRNGKRMGDLGRPVINPDTEAALAELASSMTNDHTQSS